MKSVKTSDLKANLAKYLRLARAGETIEVLDRGRPIATIHGVDVGSELVTEPARDPGGLRKLKSKVENPPKTDIVRLLMEDRNRR